MFPLSEGKGQVKIVKYLVSEEGVSWKIPAEKFLCLNWARRPFHQKARTIPLLRFFAIDFVPIVTNLLPRVAHRSVPHHRVLATNRPCQ